MKWLKSLVISTALLGAASSFAAIDALQFQSAQQESDYHKLTQELRCPQCQNNNIADSNATIAVDMRAKVFELLNEGKSKQDVVDYMVQRYGNFVTYDPPITPATILLWALPLILAIGGVVIVLRRKSNQLDKTQLADDKSHITKTNALSDAEQQRLARLLKEKE